MSEVRWHDWKSWPLKWRRVYIALWPVSAPLLTLATIAFCFLMLALLFVAWIITPAFWLCEKIADLVWDLKFEWRREP